MEIVIAALLITIGLLALTRALMILAERPRETAMGGKLYKLSKSGFEVYDPKTNRWSTLCRPTIID